MSDEFFIEDPAGAGNPRDPGPAWSSFISNYSFGEFMSHFEALEIVQKREYLHLGTGGEAVHIGTGNEHWRRTGRTIDHFSDIYSDKGEAVAKSHCFSSIVEFIGHNFRKFKWAGLTKSLESESRIDARLLRVAHLLFTAGPSTPPGFLRVAILSRLLPSETPKP